MNDNNEHSDNPIDRMLPANDEVKTTLLKEFAIVNTPLPLNYPRSKGGTGFFNFPLQQWDCECILTVLRECHKKCTCIGIFPSHVSGVFPFMKEDSRAQEIYLSLKGNGFTNFFWSVHQPMGSDECVTMFKQLLLIEQSSRMSKEEMDKIVDNDFSVELFNRLMNRSN